MKLLSQKNKLHIRAVSLYEIRQVLEATNTKDDWKAQITEQYHQFLDYFSEKLAPALPQHRTYNHKIPLMEGKERAFSSLYGMSGDELLGLKGGIEETLAKGFITASSSPARAPVLFIKKGDR